MLDTLKTLLAILMLSAAALAQQGNGPTQHSVTPSWTNTGTITGNCIYRAQTSGGPYGLAIHCSSAPITTWPDTTVLSGQTYFYVVTSYVSGPPFEESLYSNEIRAVVPQSPQAPSGLTAVAQ